MQEDIAIDVANIRLLGAATRRQVNSICDNKADDVRRQHFKYNIVIP